MTKYKFEYIWQDGYDPIAHIRSKTTIKELNSFDGDVSSLGDWSFDGSSTRQAEGFYSDCILKPVRVYPDPGRKNAFIVLSEVFAPDGTPHVTNTRNLIDNEDQDDYWFGFEQEYVLMTDDGRPIGFPDGGYPEPQGPYYCAVGYHNIAGRNIIEEHLDTCLDAGLGISGINAEVMLGQWEFQCFGKGALRACDDLIVARYLLYRITEKYRVFAELHPKPIKGDWNGSGMHSNFSNSYIRETGGEEYIEALLAGFEPLHAEHLAEYGAHNEERLTGRHETASMEKFSFGVSNRGASLRIPIYTVEHGWKGYLEDRRPASNADPYRVAARIMKTVAMSHENAIKQ
ncbi:MAG: glutamine synthetase [Chloroflexi bacterium]|nr:glutamine synthetase [Chloroflexota bacterium]